MQQSLLVNYIVFETTNKKILEDIEEVLINKYAPLINIKHNPTPCGALIAARNKCVEYARDK